MQTATIQAARLPQHLLLGWVHLAQRINAIGIDVTTCTSPDCDLAYLDEETGVLCIRADADPEDQFWVMQQAWNWLAIGPHASPYAKVQPALRLVLPQQRTDELPA
jgi:hypothetical protein